MGKNKTAQGTPGGDSGFVLCGGRKTARGASYSKRKAGLTRRGKLLWHLPTGVVTAAVTLAMALLLLPVLTVSADAADADTLESTIESWAHGGVGNLIATVSDNTVTVTGSVMDASTALSLDISSGITVVWRATLTSSVDALIEISGDGTFEVAADGSVSNAKDFRKAIVVKGEASKVMVSGGTVSATGDGGIAISAEGESSAVTVSGGTVSVTGQGGSAINAKGTDSTVEVSGGSVSATTGYAIYAEGESSNVTVSAGAVSATGIGGKAINATGTGSTVTVSGGTVSATESGGIAISAEYTASTITVSGGSVTSTTGTAIDTAGNVTVSGTGAVGTTTGSGSAIRTTGKNSTAEVSGGTVSATTGYAIAAEGNTATVTISDGTVSATNGYAIYAIGNTSTVTISDTGEVIATTGTAIKAMGTGSTVTVIDGTVTATTGTAIDTAGNVTVGGGTVSATESGGSAIKTTGTDSAAEVSGGTVSATIGYAICATGNNATVTVSGGMVENAANDHNNPVIYLFAASTDTSAVNVTVSGDGMVQAKADGWAICIRAKGRVEVKDTATVTATTGRAIDTQGNVTVSVSGGTVSATTGTAIFTFDAGSVVEVSGGTVSATSGHAIYAYNNDVTVTASGGEVSATMGKAIKATGTGSTVTVNGTGTVQATVDGGYAIESAGCVEVKDTSTVSATTGYAILANSASATVTVSGGTVSATTGCAIYAFGTNSAVTVSGGTVSGGTASSTYAIYAKAVTVSGTGAVSATTGTAIYASDAVTVSGGTVSATMGNAISTSSNGAVVISNGTVSAPGGHAIHAEGNVQISVSGGAVSTTTSYAIYTYNGSANITVSGGAVSAATGYAIYAAGADSTVTVSNGMVSTTVIGSGTAITATGAGSTVTVSGGVVYALKTGLTGGSGVINANTFTGATGTGMVIACGSGSGSRTVRTATDITFSPAGAGAYWYNNAGSGGIAYANGANTGFIPIAGVTVGKITLAAAHLGYAIPSSHEYTGSAQGIGAVTIGAEHNAYFNATSGGTLTVKYAGSSAAPANAGTYAVTAEISGGTEYAAVTISLGSYTIAKRAITLTADDKSVIKGAALPALTYTIGNLAPGETASDALSTEPTLTHTVTDTNTPGNHRISITGGTATGNYAITTATDGTLTVTERTYTVTFNLNGGVRTGGGELTQTVTEGSAAMAPTATRSGYTLSGWDTAFDNVTSDLTVTANWNSNGGGGGWSSGTTKYEAPVSGGGSESLVVTVDSGAGRASATLNASQGTRISEGKDVAVEMPDISGVSSYVLGIPMLGLSAENGDGSITVQTSIGSAALPSNMLTGTGLTGSTAQLEIGTVSADGLPEGTQATVGDRPVVSLTLSVDGVQTAWSNPNAPVIVSIPYTPAESEDENAIVVWYIDGSRNLNCVTNGRYDPESGTVTFSTTHFSDYAVGYKLVVYTDVTSASWYEKAVTYLAARGITGGTSDTTFSPDATLTRAQFITLLLRAYDIAADENHTDNFSDAGDTYYTGYLAAAKRLGISNGVGDNKFAPEQGITRQQMFTLLYNALKALDQLPEGDSGKTLSDFPDSECIASYAQEAMTTLVKTGVVGGNNGQLMPEDTTTRAQMAQMLYNLLKG